MTRSDQEAARLRRLRQQFERAQADHVGMAEARDRINRERWLIGRRESHQQAAAEPAAALCGTPAPSIASDDQDDRLEGFWWQRD